ncbi:hypothetical protein Esi_0040_0125 [Ectocarpus siliculosus]|uniref:Uncharacterized protein n=1 Tax=Ectocarpus siliculosus TaxID=2880 RepID=D7G0F2_ECTSI|nr:hypothetical protein Esi_0040_0125 [Ectocarpus siliculosus]|eukprot:CBJ26679.1 hypothetical protein Esi_0040_0125 [Ectocarpus siliculosus]
MGTGSAQKRTTSWADIVRPEGFRSSDQKAAAAAGAAPRSTKASTSQPAAAAATSNEVSAMLNTPGAFPAPGAYSGGGVGYSGLSAGPFAASPPPSSSASAAASSGRRQQQGGRGSGKDCTRF